MELGMHFKSNNNSLVNMAILNNLNITTQPQIIQEQVQQQRRLPFTDPIKAQDSSFPNRITVAAQTARRVFQILCYLHLLYLMAQDSNFPNRTVAAQTARRVFEILFYLHLFLVAVFVIFLTIYGLVSDSHTHHFHPQKWYPPLLASTACAGIVGFTWQWITARHPTRAVKLAFWLSPLLTCAMGVLFVCIGSAVSLAAGVIALVSALIQSLYGCWVRTRFEYATKVLSVSIAFPPTKTKELTLTSIVIGILYCCFLVSGIGGARAIESRTKLASFFILVILLSLGWTLQFLKNAMYVTISRVKYMHFAGGVDMDTRVAFGDTIKYLTGSVSIGSILVPLIGLFRGFARSTSLVGGDTDEFMFSCVSCYMGIASLLVTCGNRWGFVHVGVYNKGFVQASSDTWEMFIRVGLEQLIDLDLTGAFCFLSGVAAGSICSLVSGIWSLLMHKNYAIEVSIYAFLIGYFMCRLAIAWLQACVSAYYVAYAENPQSAQFDSTIPVRLEQLNRSQAMQIFRANNFSRA
ncbi:protein PNS1-like [Abrus precatorius]|uniref:Choline transporter-like protein n=1 Tax=Abrus precatorius TaxID=3816 RepID=A0A8B8L6W9_ABRPR|nr:protein PNS1-like [Abrus precatorius]